MTALAPRVPFAPLDNPRLQHLANAKNRQNGLSAQKSSILSGKPSIVKNSTPPSSTLKNTSPNKRPYEVPIFEDHDSENVDPSSFDSSPPKKTKSSDSPLAKPFTFSLISTKSMPPPSAFSSFSTPIKSNISAPRTPMTAPADRSPKRKIANIGKNRRVSAPFSRIDPPFAQRSSSALPFSLDAALSGSLSSPSSAATAAPSMSTGATIQESMPKNWFFDIYEDTPEEEAANLMEHSTLTLDLSSDEEEGGKREDDGRGKENCPPEGYDGPGGVVRDVAGAERRATRKVEVIRKKVDVGEMDDGERSPLSALETEAFIPEGLDKESYVVVDDGVEKKEVVEQRRKLLPLKKRALEKEEESEVVVWQDSEE